MGEDRGGLQHCPTSRDQIWLGDILWGKAVLGLSAPFNSADDLTLQARLGWKSWLSEVDVTAVTQDLAQYRALQVLREFLRLSAKIHLADLRPDIDLGQTVSMPSHIRDMYNLDYQYYIVSDFVLEGQPNDPVQVEMMLLP